MKNKNKFKESKRKIWILVGLAIILFLIGIINGILIGIDYTITKSAEAIGIITQGAIINVSIDINETQMVDRAYENLKPYLNQSNNTIK